MAPNALETPPTLDEQYVEYVPSGESAEVVAITEGSTTASAYPGRGPRSRTLRRAVINAWLVQAMNQLRAIENLSAGWDSQGAKRPSAHILNAATELLQALAQACEFPKPRVNPTPAGGVQFEWENGDRYFEIELISPKEAHCYFCDGDAGQEDEVVVRCGDRLEKVLNYIARIIAR